MTAKGGFCIGERAHGSNVEAMHAAVDYTSQVGDMIIYLSHEALNMMTSSSATVSLYKKKCTNIRYATENIPKQE